MSSPITSRSRSSCTCATASSSVNRARSRSARLSTSRESRSSSKAPQPSGGRDMLSFQYKHGDRPLEGFTIQRAAGRGGFGEVYYAVSDSGREVALKAVLGYEQIELRGISQCMNLKSPHLVTIFDVKYNAEGRQFVI